MRIHKQRRLKPYHADGKTTFNIQNKPGVYIIYKNDQIRYIGFSGTNLYKTLYRHFQSWDDRSQIRVTFPDQTGVTVRVVYTPNAYQAQKLERALILKHKPIDNPNKYEQYTLTDNDRERIYEYNNAPVECLVCTHEEYPF